MKTLIIGGVAGGASAAARLRRLREQDDIVIFEKGGYISYANCGLPYHLSGVIEKRSSLLLHTPESFHQRFCVDVRTRQEVVSVDTVEQSVTVADLNAGKKYREHYDRLILAPGAAPVLPPFAGESDPRVFTLNDIPDMDAVDSYCDKNPVKDAVVIGGGFIGIETAENLTARGMHVCILEMAPQILAAADWDLALMAQHELERHGVTVCTGEQVQAIERDDERLKVKTNTGEYRTDLVVCAVGVLPATEFLRTSGIEMDRRGAIVVNDRMMTSAPNVYAVGDAVSVTNYVNGKKDYIPLAGPANKQGRIAADQIAGIDHRYRGTQGSAIIKIFHKTLAMTGLGERKASNFEKVHVYVKSHAGYYPGAQNMWLKLLFDKDSGQLLGAQGFGAEGVDKRIDVLSAAIRARMTVSDVTELELCYAPPFGAAKDPVNIAAYAAQNIVDRIVPVVHVEQLANRDPETEIILDVRTQKEREQGAIKGSVHIPLNELRGRLAELPKDKSLIVHCASGMRSYLACRILIQNGYRCRNLSGGYLFYREIYGQE